MQMYTVVDFRTSDEESARKAFAIRNAVFVEEQKVSREEEYDAHEDEAVHYLILHNNEAIGTARRRETPNGVKLERFAVLPAYRNKGAGSVLVHRVLSDAKSLHKKIYLHAQVAAMNVYARAGFIPEGDLFYEAGIPHYRMVFQGND
jgi:predicted GNAT family N-acyltransferase